jgi:hypothetical protein
MRQIDIYRKKLHAIQIPTVFPKPYTRMHTHATPGIKKTDLCRHGAGTTDFVTEFFRGSVPVMAHGKR